MHVNLWKIFNIVTCSFLYVIFTDSVIYKHTAGQWEPDFDNFLGGFTDETPGDHIVEFVTGGPKNYAYKLASGNVTIKCKGISLNPSTRQTVNMANLKQLVFGTGPKELDAVNPLKFKRKNNCIFSTVEIKKYRAVYTKRKILEDGINTRPFGYTDL